MSAIEARIAAGKKQAKRGGFKPIEGQPALNRYNMVRDVACQQVKVPYGGVRMSGKASGFFTYEMLTHGGDRDAFVPKAVCRAEQDDREMRRQSRKVGKVSAAQRERVYDGAEFAVGNRAA